MGNANIRRSRVTARSGRRPLSKAKVSEEITGAYNEIYRIMKEQRKIEGQIGKSSFATHISTHGILSKDQIRQLTKEMRGKYSKYLKNKKALLDLHLEIESRQGRPTVGELS